MRRQLYDIMQAKQCKILQLGIHSLFIQLYSTPIVLIVLYYTVHVTSQTKFYLASYFYQM